MRKKNELEMKIRNKKKLEMQIIEDRKRYWETERYALLQAAATLMTGKVDRPEDAAELATMILYKLDADAAESERLNIELEEKEQAQLNSNGNVVTKNNRKR